MALLTEERPPEDRRGSTIWTAEHEGDASSRPPDDVVFEILRARRRRDVLRYLDAHGGEATIGELAEYVAEENDVDRRELTSSQRKRTYVGLYQAHLPKMAGNGVIEWNKDRGLVALKEASWLLLAYLYFEPDGDEADTSTPVGPFTALRRYVGW